MAEKTSGLGGKYFMGLGGSRPGVPRFPAQQVGNDVYAFSKLRRQGQQSNNGGRSNNGGGGGGGGPVSTLAGLPQTPELAALIKSGLIREGMAPEQALAILATSKLGTQVPIDIAALKAMIAGDYATSTAGVAGPAQEWMQQLMGANAPQPGDPLYAQYMADPIFSEYAGGLQQMQETANTNQATDQAWMDKQQQAMTDYYNGLMASIGTAGAAGGSGGGGGGGGRRHYGGGGGGSGGGGDNPYGFGDARTTAASEQKVVNQSQTTLDEMNPGYWQNMLSNDDPNNPGLAQFVAGPDAAGNMLSPEDQAIINEYANLTSTLHHGDPNQIMEEVAKDWEESVATEEAQARIAEGNTNFDANQAPQLNAELSRYLQARGLELGDDPNQPGLQTFHQALDANGDPIPGSVPMEDIAGNEALAPIEAKLENIFAPTNAPGAGMAFDPASAIANKIFEYVNSRHNLDPEAERQALENYSGPTSTLNLGVKGGILGGGTPASTGGGNHPVDNAAPPVSVEDLTAQQTSNPDPAPAPPAGVVSSGNSIQNTIASQIPTGNYTPENQTIWDALLPVANVDPTTGQPPADESNGMVWNGSMLVPAPPPQSSAPWTPAQLGNWRNIPKPPPDLTNIMNVIASQMPPSTGAPAGSIPGSPMNPTTYDAAGIPMNAPTTTPTGIPIGEQSGPGFEEFDGGTQEMVNQILAQKNHGNWDPSQLGGWHIPQSVKDSIFGPGPQSTAEQAATNVNGGFMVPNPSEIVPRLMPGLAGAGDSAKEQIFSQPSVTQPALNEQDLSSIFNDPYVAPTNPAVGFGSSRMMPEQALLGMPPITGDKTPLPPFQPDPVQLAQAAQQKVIGGGFTPPPPAARVPQTAASLFQNMSLQGIPYAEAVQQLLADTYSGDPEAANQEWLASGAAPVSGTAVGDDRMVTPTNVVDKWQTSRFNPQTGMISEDVMNSLRASSLPDFIASHQGINPEMLDQMDPGQFWRTPEDPEAARIRALQQVAREFMLGKSRLASTYWNPAIYKNREQQTVTNTDKLSSTARSYAPEAAALTTLNLQDPQLIEPETSLDYTPGQDQIFNDNEVIGFRRPSNEQQMFTKPPAPVMDNINNFVNNLGGNGKRTMGGLGRRSANPQSAVKRAAGNRLQAQQAMGGKQTMGGLGGKFASLLAPRKTKW